MGHGTACSAKKVKQRQRRRRQRRRQQQQRRQNQRENNNCYTCFGNARKGWKRALAQHTNNIDDDDDDDCGSWLLSGEQRRPPSHCSSSSWTTKCRSTENRSCPMKCAQLPRCRCRCRLLCCRRTPPPPLSSPTSSSCASCAAARVRTGAARMTPRCELCVGVNESVCDIVGGPFGWGNTRTQTPRRSGVAPSCCKGQLL